jgi:hypothetical protein
VNVVSPKTNKNAQSLLAKHDTKSSQVLGPDFVV